VLTFEGFQLPRPKMALASGLLQATNHRLAISPPVRGTSLSFRARKGQKNVADLREFCWKFQRFLRVRRIRSDAKANMIALIQCLPVFFFFTPLSFCAALIRASKVA
jgi:hypothetical protein